MIHETRIHEEQGPCCDLCGSSEVETDEASWRSGMASGRASTRGSGFASVILIRECRRCDHRWTQARSPEARPIASSIASSIASLQGLQSVARQDSARGRSSEREVASAA